MAGGVRKNLLWMLIVAFLLLLLCSKKQPDHNDFPRFFIFLFIAITSYIRDSFPRHEGNQIW